MKKIDDLGKSVLGELAHDKAIDEMSCDIAADASYGGNMGALISETPELGQSAYQMPHVPDGKAPVKR